MRRTSIHRACIVLATALSVAISMAAAVPVAAQDFPRIPDPVPVAVDRATTAVLIMDFVDPLCPSAPACMEALPNVVRILSWARAEGLFVVHTRGGNGTALPDVAPIAGEPSVEGRADKFLNTPLDQLLRDKGIKTLIVTGYSGTGAVLYTSFEANARGYTVVAMDDAMPTALPVQAYIARFQLLNQPGAANPDNQPLRERMVTLSRSDLVTIK